MNNEKITWHTVNSQFNKSRIVATIGVTDQEELVCVAYHYDFKDFNYDGKRSIVESAIGFLSTNKNSFDVAIGEKLLDIFSDPQIGLSKIHSAQVSHYLQTFKTAVKLVNFLYFKALIGPNVSLALTAAKITGVKHFIYNQSFQFLIKKLL